MSSCCKFGVSQPIHLYSVSKSPSECCDEKKIHVVQKLSVIKVSDNVLIKIPSARLKSTT